MLLKFLKIHRKAPVPEPATLLNKKLWDRFFSLNLIEHLQVTASENSKCINDITIVIFD